MGAGGAAQVLSAQHPLLGHGPGHRRLGQVRGQLGEGVGAGRDLGERPEGEPGRPRPQHAGCLGGRAVQGHPVLDIGGHRPQRTPPFHRLLQPLPQVDQPGPFASGAQPVDRAQQRRRVPELHQLGQPFLGQPFLGQPFLG
jgi:hypothetical protein